MTDEKVTVGYGDHATVLEKLPEARTALCPHCGTRFPADKAPWTQQKLHCPKHDTVRMIGTTCEFCDQEANAPHEAVPGSTLEDAIQRARNAA